MFYTCKKISGNLNLEYNRLKKQSFTLAIIVLVTTLFLSCNKDNSKPLEQSINNTNDTIATWSLINESNSNIYNNITDIEEKGTGQIWIASVNNNTSDVTSKISGFNNFLNNFQVIDSNTSHFLKSRVSSIGFNNSLDLYLGAKFNSTPGLSKEIIIETNGVFTNYNAPGGTAYNFENFYFNSSGLWYGSGNGGLVNFKNSNFTTYDSWNSDIPYPNVVRDIITVNGQDFWFTASDGLLKKTGTVITLIKSNVFSYGMDKDSEGNLWLAGYEHVLYKFDGTDTSKFNIPTMQISNIDITDLVCDSYDNIWIATDGDGLHKFNGNSWIHYLPTNSELHSTNISKLKIDSYGNLWIGSSNAGVVRLNKFGTQN